MAGRCLESARARARSRGLNFRCWTICARRGDADRLAVDAAAHAAGRMPKRRDRPARPHGSVYERDRSGGVGLGDGRAGSSAALPALVRLASRRDQAIRGRDRDLPSGDLASSDPKRVGAAWARIGDRRARAAPTSRGGRRVPERATIDARRPARARRAGAGPGAPARLDAAAACPAGGRRAGAKRGSDTWSRWASSCPGRRRIRKGRPRAFEGALAVRPNSTPASRRPPGQDLTKSKAVATGGSAGSFPGGDRMRATTACSWQRAGQAAGIERARGRRAARIVVSGRRARDVEARVRACSRRRIAARRSPSTSRSCASSRCTLVRCARCGACANAAASAARVADPRQRWWRWASPSRRRADGAQAAAGRRRRSSTVNGASSTVTSPSRRAPSGNRVAGGMSNTASVRPGAGGLGVTKQDRLTARSDDPIRG
jgi:hypothetical protein